MRKIPFNNLNPLDELLSTEVDIAVQRVLRSGWYILGPEVERFEVDFAAYHSVRHAVGVANGTDAIELALRAAGVGTGDEVITTAHTAVATVCAVERSGATPILVDIDPYFYTIDPTAVEAAITSRTKAIIPVHLYGQPADITSLRAIADRHHLLLIEDCAQAHGARYNDQRVGTFGHLAAFSFYPTKNLGAYGDGGAVITNDDQFADKLRKLRNYGQSTRYVHVESGINSRLDELQAAILQVKLRHLDEGNAQRRVLATEYSSLLQSVHTPAARPNAYHVYHLYVIRHPHRDQLAEALRDQGIGTLIHYPIPIHKQQAYAHLNFSLPITERIAGEILSLPLYIGLTSDDVAFICEHINKVTTDAE
jgi:dTDP-4-amino-4,6-dideoxygalactose transaminase